ncbi:protein SDA1 [Hyaloraphidium curvatum]|nr:protein SDA1 [Hyaloraphidium curvatum]
MTRHHGGRAALLASNLPQLQNLIKRDPPAYRDEFLQQWRHYQSLLALFRLKPDGASVSKEFGDLVTFLAHVVGCYPDVAKEFPGELIELVSEKGTKMDAELRKVLVTALILLRNKGSIDEISLLSLFFNLFRLPDKQLRQQLHNHIVSDIKNSNAKVKNNKLNKVLQNRMYEMVKDSNEIAAKKSLEVMIDLYRKNVWNDAKTVNVIAETCLLPSSKLVATALHFFLGSDRDDKKDSDDEGDAPDISAIKRAAVVAKKTRKRQTVLDKAVAKVKRKQRNANRAEHFNFSALHLINDPQGFGEKLFSRIKQATQSNELRFEVRLMMINLVSRLIGVHKLMLLGFHSFLIRYLNPSQKEVTAILAYTAQASHELVPPDDITPLVQAIANNFVWSNASPEVIVTGLNSLREICTRCPLAMPEELLKSLVVDFKGHREKGVGMAVRSLIGLFREVNPTMLPKKQRGKAATIKLIDGDGSVAVAKYGETRVADGIDGADLLLDDDEHSNAGSDVAPEGSDDEEGWEDLSGSGSDVELNGESGSASEDEDGSEGASEAGEEGSGSEGEEVDLDAMLESGEWELASEGDEEEDSSSGDEEADAEPPSDPKDGSGAQQSREDAAGNGAPRRRESIVSATSLTSTAVSNRKRRIEEERLLTDEDFRKLKKLRMKRDAERLVGKRPVSKEKDRASRNGLGGAGEDVDLSLSDASSEDEGSDEGQKEFVDPSDLLKGFKRKADRETKLAAMQAGREGRDKYGSKKAHRREEGPPTSTTNKEKSKKKNFMMMVHKQSVKGKAKQALKQKRAARIKHKRLQKKQKKR